MKKMLKIMILSNMKIKWKKMNKNLKVILQSKNNKLIKQKILNLYYLKYKNKKHQIIYSQFKTKDC